MSTFVADQMQHAEWSRNSVAKIMGYIFSTVCALSFTL